MSIKIVFSFLLTSLLSSCISDHHQAPEKFSFYHWKSKANYKDSYEKALKLAQSNKIYLHYFDVEAIEQPSIGNGDIYPNYVLKTIEREFQKLNIVPVVYITNSVFKTKNLDISNLTSKIKKLVNQISQTQFKREITEIQVDCDWSNETKNAYFEFLIELKQHFKIDVTIRLHQIKFKDITGIPPVSKGTLMLYNVGDLKNKQQNSILESNIVEKYIGSSSQYPILLNLGLPLFSQTIVFNNENKVKIIKDSERKLFETDEHFERIDETNFRVVQDTLYKGIYLSENYQLKLEEVAEDEIIKSYQLIKASDLLVDEIIFYHLDENSLSNTDLKYIIEKL